MWLRRLERLIEKAAGVVSAGGERVKLLSSWASGPQILVAIKRISTASISAPCLSTSSARYSFRPLTGTPGSLRPHSPDAMVAGLSSGISEVG